MRSGLHLHKAKGFLIAENFLQKAVEDYPTAVGFALASNGQVLHGSFPSDEHDIMDAITKIQNKYKDNYVHFHLTKAGEGELGFDSLQPFPILMKGDDTLLAVMLEGEFLNFVKPGEETPEYHIVNDYLKSKITEIYKEAGTLEKCCAKLESPTVRADLQPHLDPRGLIVFIPARGKAFNYSKNNLAGEFEWGSASKTLGFPTLKKQEAPETNNEGSVMEPLVTPAVANRPLTLRERAARKKALDAAAISGEKAIKGEDQVKEAAPPPRPDPKPIEIIKPEEKKDKLPPESPFSRGEGNILWCKPPAGSSWSGVKAFWNRNCRMNRPKSAEEVYAGFPASQLKHSAPLFAFLSDQDKAKLASSDSAFRDAMTKAEANKDGKKAATKADEYPGVITVDEKRNIVELRKNDVYWKQTPEELLNFSGDILKYSEQVQVPFEDLLHASIKFGMRLTKRELIWLWHETRNELLKARSDKTSNKKVEGQPQPVAPAKPLTLRERAAAKKAAA